MPGHSSLGLSSYEDQNEALDKELGVLGLNDPLKYAKELSNRLLGEKRSEIKALIKAVENGEVKLEFEEPIDLAKVRKERAGLARRQRGIRAVQSELSGSGKEVRVVTEWEMANNVAGFVERSRLSTIYIMESALESPDLHLARWVARHELEHARRPNITGTDYDLPIKTRSVLEEALAKRGIDVPLSQTALIEGWNEGVTALHFGYLHASSGYKHYVEMVKVLDGIALEEIGVSPFELYDRDDLGVYDALVELSLALEAKERKENISVQINSINKRVDHTLKAA